MEMISRFSTGWSTHGEFFSDANGRQTMRRQRNFRPTWNVTVTEPVAGNYYPVTSFISLRGEEGVLSVLPDRAQGGSSLQDGQIELMVRSSHKMSSYWAKIIYYIKIY